jgi:hypothetical protein
MKRRNLSFVVMLGVGLVTALPGLSVLAQPAGVQMVGTVDSLADNMVTLTSGDSFQLADSVNVTQLHRIMAADLSPGQYLSIAASRGADDALTASFVSIFPESVRGRGEGQRELGELGFCAPMCQAGDLMTNANVDEATLDSVDGGELMVSFSGQNARVRVTPDTRLSMQTSGSTADLVPGVELIGFINAQGLAGTIWAYVDF